MLDQGIPRTPTEYRRWWRANTSVPYGYCWCGCGRKTTIAGGTDRPAFNFRGEPRRFVVGHQARRPDRRYEGAGPNRNGGYCECGCGELAPIADRHSERHGYIAGQPRRFIRGHYRHQDRAAAEGAPETPSEYREWWSEQRPDIPYGCCWCGCGQQTSQARQGDRKLNYVRGEPVRYVDGHGNVRPADRPDYLIEDRGYETPCWVWQRYVNPLGYGTLAERQTGRRLLAHRLYFERHRGPIPPDRELDHLCAPFGGPRSCVNPEHLEPVYPGENVRRGAGTKLTPQAVREIRALLAEGALTQTAIGKLYGVSRGAIKGIKYGINWRDV